MSLMLNSRTSGAGNSFI